MEMEGLSMKQEKILSLIKPYAIPTKDNPNTVNMIVFLVLGAKEYGLEDEAISILEDDDNYGLSFDSIAPKIYSLFPKVEYTDDDEEEEQ